MPKFWQRFTDPDFPHDNKALRWDDLPGKINIFKYTGVKKVLWKRLTKEVKSTSFKPTEKNKISLYGKEVVPHDVE